MSAKRTLCYIHILPTGVVSDFRTPTNNMSSFFQVKDANVFRMRDGIIQVGYAVSVLVVKQVPDEQVSAVFRWNQHGRKAPYEELSIEGICTLRSSQPCHHIERDLKACIRLGSAWYRIAFDDNWIHKHVVPALTIGRFQVLFPFLHGEIDLAKNVGPSRRSGQWVRSIIDADIADEWRAVSDSKFIRGGAKSSTKPCKLFADLCDGISCPKSLSHEF